MYRNIQEMIEPQTVWGHLAWAILMAGTAWVWLVYGLEFRPLAVPVGIIYGLSGVAAVMAGTYVVTAIKMARGGGLG